MKVIKKLNLLSVAKITGLLYGGIYLIVGLIINLTVLFLGVPTFVGFDLLGFGSGVLATFLVALLVGAISFVLGAILAWLYNIATKIVGGIKWDEDIVADSEPLLKDKGEGEKKKGSQEPQEEVNRILDQTRKEEPRETFLGRE